MDDKKAVEEALEKIDLLDAHLDLDLKTNITHLEEDMGEITHWDTLAQWVILPQKSLTVYFVSFICNVVYLSWKVYFLNISSGSQYGNTNSGVFT